MTEIVKYGNDMNKLSFKGFSKNHMDLFMAICSRMKDKNTQEVRFDFREILELSKVKPKDKAEFVELLDQTSDRLMKVNCKMITGGVISKFVLFPTFDIDTDNETLVVAVNQRFTWLLNELKQYTIFELAEFTQLQSKYSKNLYRILKQWRTTGAYTFHDVAEFRELLDIPKSYQNRDITEKVIKTSVSDIRSLDGSFSDLSFEILRSRKQGRAVTGYEFKWTPEEKGKTVADQERDHSNDVPKQTKRRPKTQKEKFGFDGRQYDYSELENIDVE